MPRYVERHEHFKRIQTMREDFKAALEFSTSLLQEHRFTSYYEFLEHACPGYSPHSQP